jgi:hypothetical protein
MARSQRQSDLLATDRWSWLEAFLTTWYADPLDAADGATSAELDEAEDRIGQPLPTAVREWFELVASRLVEAQDLPLTPSSLWADEDGVAVWQENQGVWSILIDDDGLACLDEPDEFDFPPVPVVTALRAMVVSDTIAGIWSGSQFGPLGQLSAQVRGGCVEDADGDLFAACKEQYPPLDFPGNPFFPIPPRGDGATLLRGDQDWGSGLEWATATKDAFAGFTSIVDVEPPGGEYRVRLVLEQLTETEQRPFLTVYESPELSRFDPGPGRIAQGAAGPGRIEAIASTTDPLATASALLASVPEQLRDRAEVSSQPVRLASWTIIHPPGTAPASDELASLEP